MTKMRVCPDCGLTEQYYRCPLCGCQWSDNAPDPRLLKAIEEMKRLVKNNKDGDDTSLHELMANVMQNGLDIIYKHIPEVKSNTLEDMLSRVTDENKHEVKDD